MCTCAHRATCCRCVCVLGVSARNRDAEAGVTVDCRIVTVVGGNRDAPILFRGFSIAVLPWHPGVTRMRRMLLCRGLGRSVQGPDVLFGPRTANGNSETASDRETFTVTNEYFLPHVREVDTPTLSTEFQQSVGNADTARTLIQHGFSWHRARSRETCRMAASKAPRSASESGWNVYRHSADTLLKLC